MSPTPILFVHDGREWIRGSERCLLDLVAGLDRARYRPIVWCNAGVLAEAAREFGAETVTGDWTAAQRARMPLGLVSDGLRIIRRYRVGLVHANALVPLRWLIPAARTARVPVVAHLHLLSTALERCLTGLHQVAIAVGVSEAVLRGPRTDGMAESRLALIYNGLDPLRLGAGAADALRGELGISPVDTVVAAVGSLIDRKGHDVLLHAMSRLARGGRQVRLLLVGDGEERPALEGLAAELGLGDRVHFLGARRDAGAIIRDAADIVASAARSEAFGLNLAEAALFGVPAVASDVDGHREAIRSSETGLLVPRDDADAFARAVATFIDDPMLRRRYGEAARRDAAERFPMSRYLSAFEALYAELLARPAWGYGWLGKWTWPRAYNPWLGGAIRRRLLPRRPANGSPAGPRRPRRHHGREQR